MDWTYGECGCGKFICQCYVPPSAAALLGPGIRARLMRYGSMKSVEILDSPLDDRVVVNYTLITGETGSVGFPVQWFREDRYKDILDAVVKDLG